MRSFRSFSGSDVFPGSLSCFGWGCPDGTFSGRVLASKRGARAPRAGSAARQRSPPGQGDWVVQRIASDVDSLNPLTLESADGQLISALVNEGMLQMNNFTLKLEPCLAESYEIAPDQLTYTFHLRHGVKWHDGDPFTAADVRYTYDRLQDPKVDAAQLRTYFTNIKSCEVLDPYTVRFTATERYFKTLEELGELQIIPKHILEKGEADFNKHPFGRHPIGTGPYKFVRWDTGSQSPWNATTIIGPARFTIRSASFSKSFRRTTSRRNC